MTDQGQNRDRYDVRVEARLKRQAHEAQAAQIVNLSRSGCRFTADRALALGTPISIEAGRASPIEARVVWRVGKIHGARFARLLPRGVLDHIRLFLSQSPALVAERQEEAEAA